MNPIAWRVEHFDQIDSTNTWALEQAEQGAEEGLVALADFQTHGRGRLERRWVAPARTALLCSILLRPPVEVDEPQLGVIAVTLAARAALVRLCGVRPDLKWPNDLMVGPDKIAGVLAQYVGGARRALVVGIGVNLASGSEPDTGATSVWREAGVNLEPRALLDILLEELEPRRQLLDSVEGRRQLRDEYQCALTTIGRRVRVHQFDTQTSGLAVGVDEEGRLLVDTGDTTTAFASGDVVHLRLDEADRS